MVIFIVDVSWEVSTPSSPVQVLSHLPALQLTPSLPGLGEPERPLFTSYLLVDIQRSLIGRGVLTTQPFIEPLCWSVGVQCTTSSGIPTNLACRRRVQFIYEKHVPARNKEGATDTTLIRNRASPLKRLRKVCTYLMITLPKVTTPRLIHKSPIFTFLSKK